MAEKEIPMEELGDITKVDYDYDDDDDDDYDNEEEDFINNPKTSTSHVTSRPYKAPKMKETSFSRKLWEEPKTPELIKINEKKVWVIIEKNFPNLDKTDKFLVVAGINEDSEVVVILKDRINASPHILFDEKGNINKEIGKTIRKILGKQINKFGLREQIMILEKEKEDLKKEKDAENLFKKKILN